MAAVGIRRMFGEVEKSNERATMHGVRALVSMYQISLCHLENRLIPTVKRDTHDRSKTEVIEQYTIIT